MNVKIIFEGNVNSQDAVRKMIAEDCLFDDKVTANSLLATLGSRIDRIETVGENQTIYIKPLQDNVLFG